MGTAAQSPVKEAAEYRVRRNPPVRLVLTGAGPFMRCPSAGFSGPHFRLITARQHQHTRPPPLFGLVWMAARKEMDLAALVERVRRLPQVGNDLPAEAVAGAVHAMAAAGFLLSRPPMGPFIPLGRHEAHVFSFGAKTLAIDPMTCSLWELTGDAASCLAEFSGPAPEPPDEAAPRPFSPAAAELGACRVAGFFAPPPSPSPSAPEAPRTATAVFDQVSLTLELSQVCNLACRYCYAGRPCAGACFTPRPGREAAPAVMSDDAMRDAVDFVFRTVPARRYKITFVPNGEPLLHLKRTREIQLYARQRARELGLKVEFPSRVSNAVNLTPELLRRWKACFPAERFTLSLDGPEDAHDAMRVDSRGRGSYAEVVRAVNLLRSEGRLGVVGAVLTPAYPKVLEIFQHLRSLGAEWISIKPVRLAPSHPLAFNETNIEELCNEYTRFANWLLEQEDRELMRLLRSLSRIDYFRRFVQRLAVQQAMPHRCYAASRHTLMVDHRGDIYACERMMGNESARIGSIHTGIDAERLKFFERDLAVVNIARCRSCWARFICGGGCYHQAFLTNGRFDEPDPAECRLNRHIIELAGWLLANLADRGPNPPAGGLRAAAETVRPRPPRRPFALSVGRLAKVWGEA